MTFPNFLEAIDGKHVAILPSAGAGSHFFNNKGNRSIFFMAKASVNYDIIHVEVDIL